MTKISPDIFPDYFTAELINSCKLLSLTKGEYLFHTDDKVQGIYYVIKGEIKALRHQIKGSDVVMVRSQKGDYFAESALAVDNYICDAVCTRAAQVAFLPKNNFITSMKNSDFSLAFSLSLAKNARQQCSRYERMRLHKAKDRLLHFLICESDTRGQLIWHSPLVELAGELAIEPETLYRVVAELQHDGSIHRDKRHFKLM